MKRRVWLEDRMGGLRGYMVSLVHSMLRFLNQWKMYCSEILFEFACKSGILICRCAVKIASQGFIRKKNTWMWKWVDRICIYWMENLQKKTPSKHCDQVWGGGVGIIHLHLPVQKYNRCIIRVTSTLIIKQFTSRDSAYSCQKPNYSLHAWTSHGGRTRRCACVCVAGRGEGKDGVESRLNHELITLAVV